jgi:hypothetical protein
VLHGICMATRLDRRQLLGTSRRRTAQAARPRPCSVGPTWRSHEGGLE